MGSKSCNGIVMNSAGKSKNWLSLWTRGTLRDKAVEQKPLSCSSSYNVLRKDREKNNGGGIAFLLHSSVSCIPLDTRADSNDDHFAIQGIAVRSGEVEIEIFNINIYLVAACGSGYSPTLDFLLEGQNRIILVFRIRM